MTIRSTRRMRPDRAGRPAWAGPVHALGRPHGATHGFSQPAHTLAWVAPTRVLRAGREATRTLPPAATPATDPADSQHGDDWTDTVGGRERGPLDAPHSRRPEDPSATCAPWCGPRPERSTHASKANAPRVAWRTPRGTRVAVSRRPGRWNPAHRSLPHSTYAAPGSAAHGTRPGGGTRQCAGRLEGPGKRCPGRGCAGAYTHPRGTPDAVAAGAEGRGSFLRGTPGASAAVCQGFYA